MNLNDIKFAFEPSKYQYDFFNWIINGTGSAILQARAGSGKTSTLVEALKLIPSTKSVLYLAFNRHIAAEIKRRVNQPNVTIKTFHGLGYSALQNMRPNIILEERKSYKLLIPELNLSNLDKSIYTKFIMRLLSCGKNAGVGKLVDDVEESWDNLIDHFDLDIDAKYLDPELVAVQKEAQINQLPIPNYSELAEKKAIQLTQRLLQVSNEIFKKRGIIDFDDMLYLPLIFNLRFDQYDFILNDEAQDDGPTQHEIIAKTMHVNSRFIACGDSKQSIYAFRNADENSVPNLQKRFNCTVLPLTISYRCPKTVITEAKRIVSDIEAWEKAEDGTVQVLQGFEAKQFKVGDVILCRNNAPLLDPFFWFTKHGIGTKIIGRDIATGLVNLIKKIPTEDLKILSLLLKEYLDKEIKRLIEKGKEDKAARLAEKIECIEFIISNSPTVKTTSDLVLTIESMFTDDTSNSIILSTVHKFKGLEVNNVYILNRYLFSGKYAKHDWEIQQERNLSYVAVTRVKKNLYFIDSKDKLLDVKNAV